MHRTSPKPPSSPAPTILSTCLRRVAVLASNKQLNDKEKDLVKSLLLAGAVPDQRVMACFQAAPGGGGEEDDEELASSLRALVNPQQQIIQPATPTIITSPRGPRSVQVTPVLGPIKQQQQQHSFRGPRTVLFAAKDMTELAQHAMMAYPTQFSLGKISWERFDEPEGWPNVFIEAARELPQYDAMFLASFHSPQVVFEQLSVIYALARYGLRKLIVVVPFFATGTMERIERVGEVATAASLARILSMIPQCASGPTQLLILDIHALQERFYFTDNVIVHLKSCVRLLNEEIANLEPREEPICIVFPDDGAWKRFHTKFEDRHMVVCHKIRDGTSRVVRIRDGIEFVQGAHCIIVDDLVKSGGTLIECGLVLQSAGAKKISAYVTHGVFPADSWKKFVRGDVGNKFDFYRFWITDSIPTTVKHVKDKEPFRVLSIVPVLSQIQSFYDDGRFDG